MLYGILRHGYVEENNVLFGDLMRAHSTTSPFKCIQMILGIQVREVTSQEQTGKDEDEVRIDRIVGDNAKVTSLPKQGSDIDKSKGHKKWKKVSREAAMENSRKTFLVNGKRQIKDTDMEIDGEELKLKFSKMRGTMEVL